MIEEYREMLNKYHKALISYDEWCDYCIETLRYIMVFNKDALKKIEKK